MRYGMRPGSNAVQMLRYFRGRIWPVLAVSLACTSALLGWLLIGRPSSQVGCIPANPLDFLWPTTAFHFVRHPGREGFASWSYSGIVQPRFRQEALTRLTRELTETKGWRLVTSGKLRTYHRDSLTVMVLDGDSTYPATISVSEAH